VRLTLRTGPPPANQQTVTRNTSGTMSSDFSKNSRPPTSDSAKVTRCRVRRVRTYRTWAPTARTIASCIGSCIVPTAHQEVTSRVRGLNKKTHSGTSRPHPGRSSRRSSR